MGRSVRVALAVLICVGAFAVKLLRPEPAWTYAKIDCLVGREEPLRRELQELRVSSRDIERIQALCAKRPPR